MPRGLSGFPIVDPATGRQVRAHPAIDAAEAARRIELAHAAWTRWRSASFEDRAAVLTTAASLLRDRVDALASRCTEEMGKPISEARAEIEKCAWVCAYYAEHAESMLADEVFALEHASVRLVSRPIGVVYAIMPWNFPFWQVFRAAAPNLMAGNAMVLKHSPNTMGCGADITALLGDAGLPTGLFADLPIDVADSPSVIRHRHVRGVTLTGSGAAGRAVASEAGSQLKKCVLELGGSDPYVVLSDANIEWAAERCVASRMLNCGQVCIAAKRLIAVDGIFDQFQDSVMRHMQAIDMRDPIDEASALGPMAREDLRSQIHEQVCGSLAAGATCLLGGEIPDRAGWWYPPTVLTGVAPGMPAFDEELFGPVACLVRADDEQHAMTLAQATPYGLAAAVFTNDAARGTSIGCDSMEAGCVAINDSVRSDPRVPFGGVKSSGFGRELGRAGIHEFVNLKSVVTARMS